MKQQENYSGQKASAALIVAVAFSMAITTVVHIVIAAIVKFVTGNMKI